jgi:hypothetical protein
MKMLKTALVIIIATIKLSATTAPIEPTDAIFNGKTAYQLKQMAADAMNALAAGGGGAGPAAAESAALAQCITSGDNTPYINLAKAKIKEILANDAPGAVISAATPNKATLLQQLNVFIDTLNSNAALGLGANAPVPGNDNAHLVSARKAAIDVAMVQKVNAKMDELVGAGAQPIKDALMAVFAGR